MSPEFMNSVDKGYCTIGYSTKRDREDQIGYYGFGRLVNLSYVRDTTKQYWVHTVYEGVAYEYLIFLDGNSVKQTLLSKTLTEEPCGTRVVVQLKKDYYEFSRWERAIKEQCAYFEGTVIDIDGYRSTVEVDTNGLIKKSSLYNGNSHLVLGSVYYDIDWEFFAKWRIIEGLNIGIHIGLDEGVIPVPSREMIVYNELSKNIIENKFKIILENIWKQCDKELQEISNQNIIERLSFLNRNSLSLCLYSDYKKICDLLFKTPIEIIIDNRVDFFSRHTYSKLKDCFKGSGIFCQHWTPLKKEYVYSLGCPCAERSKTRFDLIHLIETSNIDKESKRTLASELENKLITEWINFYYTKFDEVGFEQWKKNRKGTKRISQGITYYRQSLVDSSCVKDKGELDLSVYRYIFKATESTAKRYWTFFNQTFRNFIIIKGNENYAMDLDNLEPSPLLKRMCSEALKAKVYNILREKTNDPIIRKIINEVNPLLAQYLNDIPLKDYSYLDVHEALVEVGEKFGCFDKDEMKLKYMEHHLKLLEFAKYVGHKKYNWEQLKIGDAEAKLIKRHYILERLAEKKWKEEETPVNVNQLEIQFN